MRPKGPTASVALAALLVLVGCAPGGPGAPSRASDGAQTSDAVGSPKTLTLAVTRPIDAFGPWDPSGSGGTFSTHNLHSAPLITTDPQGQYEGRLLASLPSFEDGTIVVLPDGRMQTTWRLRPNVKWHDGAPFTAEDLVFTLQVNTHPEVPLRTSIQIQYIERIDVQDPLTAVVTWKNTFYQPLYLGLREVWPLPKHLLAEPFQGDKQAFVNHPYWTTQYVHLGPFRLADFGLGETLLFERFDDYFLGRPRVSRLALRIFGDPNALFANLMSGTLDIVPENALPFDLFVQLRDQWKQSGDGTIMERQANWRFLAPQFHPEWARPLEVSRDVRVRRGLYQAFDREMLREAVLPGFGELTEADTFMDRGDPRAAAVGKPFARYRYDVNRALQELADAGWRRGGDGRMLNSIGEQVQITLRSSPGDDKEIAIIAQYWRDIGINAVEELVPGALRSDREYLAKFPGFEAAARGSGDFSMSRFDSRQLPTAQNRWVGINGGSYSSPAFDRLLDRLYSTIDERDQGGILKEMGDSLAAELPALSMYFQVKMAATARGIRALADDYAGANGPGALSRNAHLWDREPIR